jgi:hypothetical protein
MTKDSEPTNFFQKIKNIFRHRKTPEEVEEEKKIAILDQLYADIKAQRAQGDYYGKYPNCRYTWDAHDGVWINQGVDGVQGPSHNGFRRESRSNENVGEVK